jgi:hypothetical protein
MEDITLQRIIDSIDGNVHSKRIKIKFPAWMVMGSPEWDKTTDEDRAYAYQAALAMGWTKESLAKVVCSAYTHVDKHFANFTLEFLTELASVNPCNFEKRKNRPKVVITDGSCSREL